MCVGTNVWTPSWHHQLLYRIIHFTQHHSLLCNPCQLDKLTHNSVFLKTGHLFTGSLSSSFLFHQRAERCFKKGYREACEIPETTKKGYVTDLWQRLISSLRQCCAGSLYAKFSSLKMKYTVCHWPWHVPTHTVPTSWGHWWSQWVGRLTGGCWPAAASEAARTWRDLSGNPATVNTCAPEATHELVIHNKAHIQYLLKHTRARWNA